MKKPRCVYSLDWLQIYCNISKFPDENDFSDVVSPNADMYGNHRRYSLIQPLEWIKGYEWQRSVKYGKYVVAHIACRPRNCNNDANGGAIKLNNPTLYVANWHFILSDILSSLCWSAVSLTRVDLCADFNYFVNGLLPETFIRKYMCKTNDTYIKNGSNMWACYGQKELHKNTFNSIRWGSRQSGVSVYLYNKSKELDVNKYKPWIVESWKKADLNIKNVWRVEISVNSSGRGLKDVFSGIVQSLFVDALSGQYAIENIFKVYARKYFTFKSVSKGGPKRKKDMPDVQLLYLESSTDVPCLKPTTLYQSNKSSLQERRTLKALQGLKKEIEDEGSLQNFDFLNSLDDVIRKFSERSYYLHYCNNLQKDMESEIQHYAEDFLSTPEIKSRAESVGHIFSDKQYLKECASRIAKRVACLSAEGILL